MPKGEQRSNKMNRKPKKDTGPIKESVIVTNRPAPPVTTRSGFWCGAVIGMQSLLTVIEFAM